MEVVGRLDGVAGIPPCEVGQVRMADGLIAYILLAPSLTTAMERRTAPVWAVTGTTTISDLPVLRSPLRTSPAAVQV